MPVSDVVNYWGAVCCLLNESMLQTVDHYGCNLSRLWLRIAEATDVGFLRIQLWIAANDDIATAMATDYWGYNGKLVDSGNELLKLGCRVLNEPVLQASDRCVLLRSHKWIIYDVCKLWIAKAINCQGCCCQLLIYGYSYDWGLLRLHWQTERAPEVNNWDYSGCGCCISPYYKMWVTEATNFQGYCHRLLSIPSHMVWLCIPLVTLTRAIASAIKFQS